MVIRFQDYLVEFNKRHQDDNGIAVDSPEMAEKIIKLLEWYRVLYNNRLNKARSKAKIDSYQQAINNTNASIEGLEGIKSRMQNRSDK
ncbi:orf27 [Lactobacillus phage LP65]|uniref:Orf27 n=1 Tax=Lactobacillus phage LP65 TaxID=2892344 RepID=Q5ULT7_9CAUD|nr:hypothetical protein LP65_gp027 [Lactobacillus phage LP65]AAV35847.1 orf27 [Lactobacillus phage LP65]